MGYMLDLFHGQILSGFAIIFSIGFVGTFLSFILYSLIHPPRVSPDKRKVAFGFLNFVQEAKKGKLGTFIVYVSIFNFSVNLCGPLYAVYMLEDLHFSYLTFTAIISAEYLARVLSASLWGRYADKVGNIKIIGIASRFIPFTPILWLFSSNVIYLIMVQLFAGTLWAAFDMCSQSYIYKAAPEGKRFRYIVYHKSLNLLFAALGTLS